LGAEERCKKEIGLLRWEKISADELMIATKERINQNVFGMDFLGLSNKDSLVAILIRWC
jgi:hypothetical protein